MCQRFYSIPFDLLVAGDLKNTVVVLDELGATNISAAGLAISTEATPPPCGALPSTG